MNDWYQWGHRNKVDGLATMAFGTGVCLAIACCHLWTGEQLSLIDRILAVGAFGYLCYGLGGAVVAWGAQLRSDAAGRAGE